MKNLNIGQRGVAVVTVLLITVLAVSVVSGLFWDQQLQVRSIENQRLQLQQNWILKGAIDWARLILMEDKKFSEIDSLNEPWSTPLMDTRLDKFTQETKIQSGESNASLSGRIVDAQSRYNLNLIAENGKINQSELKVFIRLLEHLDQPTQLAKEFSRALVTQQKQENNFTTEHIGFETLEDLLSLSAFNQANFIALKNYIIVLPKNTKVNINTASAEVIASVLNVSLIDAYNIKALRENSIFNNLTDFQARASQLGLNIDPKGFSVKTNFFIISGRVKINYSIVETQCLIERDEKGAKLVWQKNI